MRSCLPGFAAVLAAAAMLLTPLAGKAAEETDSDLLQMVVDLVGDTDRDMRALGLQQVREEVPGEAATRRFALLLPQLNAEAQVGLLEALGDRGDPAALTAVREMLKSEQLPVRVAAILALGGLGEPADVALLAAAAASPSAEENAAAQRSLVRLKGEPINAAVLSAMESAEPKVRAALLAALAARNAREAIPAVLADARHADAQVRLAALAAIRYLAGEQDAGSVVDLVKACTLDEERRRAELALRTLCARSPAAGVAAILAGWESANTESQVILVRALGRCGGNQALEALVARLNDRNEAVRLEAVRMLCGWPDAAALPPMLQLAEKSADLRSRVLALRGLARLAGAGPDHPADVEMLARALTLADRTQEKRLLVGALGASAGIDGIVALAPLLNDRELGPDAGLAVVMIAERAGRVTDAKQREIIAAVSTESKDPALRARAKKILGADS